MGRQSLDAPRRWRNVDAANPEDWPTNYLHPLQLGDTLIHGLKVDSPERSTAMSKAIGELFDRAAEFDQWDRNRPHRAQPAVITFLTMRLVDSLPAEVIQRWHRERIAFLDRHGIECGSDWKAGRELLESRVRKRFDRQFQRAREMTVDECHGCCALADPRCAHEVADALLKFHLDRYWIGDFVIMPNHVHCLVAFISNEFAKSQPGGWMRYSAVRINRYLGRRGALWFREPFDHLVRSEPQLEYLRDYIAANPERAKLRAGTYLYRRSEGHF
jgi:type I restriction enzyme R subunit